MVEKEMHSPRLKRLSNDLARGDKAALDLLWQEVREKGTPLIEPDEEKTDFSFVTFLWQAVAATRQVILQIAVDGTGQDEHAMSQLPATDLWHATFQLRHNFQGAYKFVVTNEKGQELEQRDPFNPKTFVEPKDETRPDHAEDDWEFAPLRFYIEVGLLESSPTPSGFPGQNRNLPP